MTLNVSLAGIAPATYSRTSERSGSEMEPDDQGFAEALTGKTAKRRQPEREELTSDDRPAWKLEAYASQLGLTSDDAGDTVVTDIFDVMPGAELTGEPEQEIGVFTGDVSQPPVNPDISEDAVKTADENAGKATINTPPPSNEDDPLLDATHKAAATPPETGPSPTAALADVAASTRTVQRAPENGERQGDRRGRGTAGNSTPSPATSAEPPRQTAGAGASLPEKPERAAPTAPEREVARFIPAREALAKGNETTRNLPAASPGDALSGRVNVLGFSAALAPSPATMPLPSATAAGVIAAMEADPTWRAAAMESAALAGQHGQKFSTGVNSLKIQLHPVELGMITARLSTSGQQLSVEIQVESNDARHKLANDSETILKALRALGFDIDRITIQQSSPSSSSSPQQSAAGRDQFLPDQQAREEGDGRGRSGERGGDAKDGERGAHGPGEAIAAHAGSSLYI